MTVEDYEAVRALYEEPGTLAYMPSFFPEEEPQAYFESYVKNMYRFYDFGMYVLEDARTGKLIGHAGLGVEDREDRDGREAKRKEAPEMDGSGGSDGRKTEDADMQTPDREDAIDRQKTVDENQRETAHVETPEETNTTVKITLGYVVSAPYRGKGLAALACREILLYARDSLYLDRVWIRVDRRNGASLAVARHLQQMFGDFIMIETCKSAASWIQWE